MSNAYDFIANGSISLLVLIVALGVAGLILFYKDSFRSVVRVVSLKLTRKLNEHENEAGQDVKNDAAAIDATVDRVFSFPGFSWELFAATVLVLGGIVIGIVWGVNWPWAKTAAHWVQERDEAVKAALAKKPAPPADQPAKDKKDKDDKDDQKVSDEKKDKDDQKDKGKGTEEGESMPEEFVKGVVRKDAKTVVFGKLPDKTPAKVAVLIGGKPAYAKKQGDETWLFTGNIKDDDRFYLAYTDGRKPSTSKSEPIPVK